MGATLPSPLLARAVREPRDGWRAAAPFVVIWSALVALYGTWLLAFWPGILGEDSVAILLEVERGGDFRSGKTVFWYYFVRLFYEGTRRVEVPVAVLLCLCALIFARVLSWYWRQGLRKSFAVVLVLVCLAPHMVYFMGTLYPDGIFAVASCGLLFELWLAARQRTMGAASLAMVALALPFAAFARPNGIVFLLPAIAVLLLLDGRSRWKLAALIGAVCAAMFAGQQLHPSRTQEAVYPMVVFETVNFLRPRAMNRLWDQYPHMNDPWVLDRPKVSPATTELLGRYRPLPQLQAYADPAYWDMLVFHPEGPQVQGLPKPDQKALVREFFTYNLWQNLPDFIASRVNVFLAAALAQGGFPSVTYATYVLPRTQAASVFRQFDLRGVERRFIALQQASHAGRWLLWTPWLGMILLAWALCRGIARRDLPLLIVAFPMAVQLAAIFLLSTAGEYRYLLPFFTLPLALLPAFALRRPTPARPVSA
ncbi:DUF2142 domain-containing protein [Acidovorax sp. SUPP3434]|uniref:hypothetical protein n=1 Tax=Acidovorax sp. SUPP3434 TaxID=2920880 RepID=UPI0023DE64BC|nr:hypothetical protein [Acidovorax sp. SUPP3434]GKS98697.1 DUF2142 domain-containing protein [Acidovorax sp. SUPP3434]